MRRIGLSRYDDRRNCARFRTIRLPGIAWWDRQKRLLIEVAESRLSAAYPGKLAIVDAASIPWDVVASIPRRSTKSAPARCAVETTLIPLEFCGNWQLVLLDPPAVD